ncbi:MAG: NADH-quinone oxidoreductase subunit J [Anaerolineales bacterium]
MTPELITFIILALVAFASALGMIVSRNAVYSALYLVLNFLTVAIFYLLLNAPFIALSQVAVYAGAIMVLFLFVIMLLGAEQLPLLMKRRQFAPPIALAIVLAGVLVFWFASRAGVTGVIPAPVETFGDPRTVGVELFIRYQLPFQITAVLLLVAMIGAIILTKKEKGG